MLCEPIAEYCKKTVQSIRELSLFSVDSNVVTKQDDTRVVELFAGVGGFRIGVRNVLRNITKRYGVISGNHLQSGRMPL